jgi:hypothetical protein
LNANGSIRWLGRVEKMAGFSTRLREPDLKF